MLPLTVLLSIYNENPIFLEKSIRSIINQSFTNFEFIIIDDGSTNPETIKKLDYLSCVDTRIILKRQPNCGLTKSLNNGLNYAKGKYVARQDSDDWSHPDRIRTQLSYLTDHPNCMLLGCNFYICDQSENILRIAYKKYNRINISKTIRKNNLFCHGSVIFNRDAILSLGGYREMFPAAQDYDLFLRITETHQVAVLDTPLYFHRRGATTISSQKVELQVSARWVIRALAKQRRAGKTENLVLIENNLKKNRIVRRLNLEVMTNLRTYQFSSGNYSVALKIALQIWKQYPLSLLSVWGIFKSFFCLRRSC